MGSTGRGSFILRRERGWAQVHDMRRSWTFGALVGTLLVLLAVLVLNALVHSNGDPREMVAAVIRQEVAYARTAAVRTHKPDDRLKVYIMTPRQPNSPPANPAYPALPPGGRPPVPPHTAPDAPADLGGLQVVSVTAHLAGMTTSGPLQAWKLTVRNTDSVTHSFGALIRFHGQDGSITHTCRVHNLTATPGATVTYEGSLVIDPSLPANPAAVDAVLVAPSR